jgi:hypothetical protein
VTYLSPHEGLLLSEEYYKGYQHGRESVRAEVMQDKDASLKLCLAKGVEYFKASNKQ